MVQFDILSFCIQLIWLFSFLFISYIFVLKSILVKLARYIKKYSLLVKQFSSISASEEGSENKFNKEELDYNKGISSNILVSFKRN